LRQYSMTGFIDLDVRDLKVKQYIAFINRRRESVARLQEDRRRKTGSSSVVYHSDFYMPGILVVGPGMCNIRCKHCLQINRFNDYLLGLANSLCDRQKVQGSGFDLVARAAGSSSVQGGRQRVVDAVQVQKQLDAYGRLSWEDQWQARWNFLPYLLRDDLVDKTVSLFVSMLEQESKVIERELSSLQKNIVSLDTKSDERISFEEERERLLILQRVFCDAKNNPERVVRIIRICRIYFLNPTVSSRDVHNMLDRTIMSYYELLENYRIIQRLRIIQDMFIYDSVSQRLVGYIKEQLIMRQKLETVFSKKRESDVVPFAVEFHLARGCNARCLGCPNVDQNRNFVKYERVGEPLSLDRVKMLVDLFVDMGVERITFAGGGEPFVCKFLVAAIKYVREKSQDINIALYTNGIGLIGLSEEDRAVLVNCLNRLRVSMDASNAGDWSYYKGRPQEKFSMIWEVLSDLVRIRDELDAGIKLGVSCIVSRNCQGDEVSDFVKFAAGYGLDFCDIKALSESDASKSAFQATATGLMQIVDGIMTERQGGTYGRMHVALEDVFVVDWYAWKLGVAKQDIITPRHCWMARIGRKVTVGPYGGLYPCSDAANPGVLRVLNGEPRMAVLNSFDEIESLRKQFFALWNQTGGKRDSFDPPTHPYCVPSNNDYNVAVEKLCVDWDYGIALEDQPIYPESYAYLESRGIAGTGSIQSKPAARRYMSSNRQNLAEALLELRRLVKRYRKIGGSVSHIDEGVMVLFEKYSSLGRFAIPHLCRILKDAKEVFLREALLFFIGCFGADAREAVPFAVAIKKEIREKIPGLHCVFDHKTYEDYDKCVKNLEGAANRILEKTGVGSKEVIDVLRKDLERFVTYGKEPGYDFKRSFMDVVGIIDAIGPPAVSLLPLVRECLRVLRIFQPDIEEVVNCMTHIGPLAASFKKHFVRWLIRSRPSLEKDFSPHIVKGFGIGHEECITGNVLFYLGSIGAKEAHEYVPLILELMDNTNSRYVLKAGSYALSKIGKERHYVSEITLAKPTFEDWRMTLVLTKFKDVFRPIDSKVIARTLNKADERDTVYYLLLTINRIFSLTPQIVAALIDAFERINDPFLEKCFLHTLCINSRVGSLTDYLPRLLDKMSSMDSLDNKAMIAKLIRNKVDLSDRPEVEKILDVVEDIFDKAGKDSSSSLEAENSYKHDPLFNFAGWTGSSGITLDDAAPLFDMYMMMCSEFRGVAYKEAIGLVREGGKVLYIDDAATFDRRDPRIDLMDRISDPFYVASVSSSLAKFLLMQAMDRREVVTDTKENFPKTYFGRDGETIIYFVERAIAELGEKEEFNVICFGSASGEEGYDVAMSIAEYLNRNRRSFITNLIISDVLPRLVEFAERGIYPAASIKKPLRERGMYDDLLELRTAQRDRDFFVPVSDTHRRILSPAEFKKRWGINIEFKGIDVFDFENIQSAVGEKKYNLVIARNVSCWVRVRDKLGLCSYSSMKESLPYEHAMHDVVLDNVVRILKPNGMVCPCYRIIPQPRRTYMRDVCAGRLTVSDVDRYREFRKRHFKADSARPILVACAVKLATALFDDVKPKPEGGEGIYDISYELDEFMYVMADAVSADITFRMYFVFTVMVLLVDER
ncbi:MAG: radical SAM protein, partial [Candidatus Omnitrophota bacterium]